MMVSTFWVSATPSAAVGSSISTSFEAQWVARAIATPWRWPPERSRMVDVAEGMRTSMAADQFLAFADHAAAVEPAEWTGRRLATEEEVHVDRLALCQCQVLEDDLDAARL